MNFVGLHGRIPDRHVGHLSHPDSENAAEDLEHPRDHAVQGKVRPQGFLVEIVQSGALLFGPVADIPGLEFLAGERLQLLILLAEALFGLLAQIPQEVLRALAGVRHAIVQDQIGEVAEAEQLGLFLAQRPGSGPSSRGYRAAPEVARVL